MRVFSAVRPIVFVFFWKIRISSHAHLAQKPAFTPPFWGKYSAFTPSFLRNISLSHQRFFFILLKTSCFLPATGVKTLEALNPAAVSGTRFKSIFLNILLCAYRRRNIFEALKPVAASGTRFKLIFENISVLVRRRRKHFEAKSGRIIPTRLKSFWILF